MGSPLGYSGQPCWLQRAGANCLVCSAFSASQGRRSEKIWKIAFSAPVQGRHLCSYGRLKEASCKLEVGKHMKPLKQCLWYSSTFTRLPDRSLQKPKNWISATQWLKQSGWSWRMSAMRHATKNAFIAELSMSMSALCIVCLLYWTVHESLDHPFGKSLRFRDLWKEVVQWRKRLQQIGRPLTEVFGSCSSPS